MYQEYLSKLHEMIMLRGLTENTAKAYMSYIRGYLEYLETFLLKPPSDVTWDELRGYIHYLDKSKNLAGATINSIISMLGFFTIFVLHKQWDSRQIPKRKFDRKLPYILSQEDTWHFISTIPNLKHKAMISLLYSSGLRVSELCNLKWSDFSKEKMQVRIRKSKNRYEGITQLSQITLELLVDYWRNFGRPKDWVFPHPYKPNEHITSYYVRKVIKEHESRLGLEHKLTCHSFRHLVGTHLFENGADILTIKEFLRHRSLNSTLIYITLSSSAFQELKNPFDLLGNKP